MSIKVSDYVWEYVEALNVKHVFMFPGGGAMHLVDSLGKSRHLDYVTLLHEQACVMAAETYSRIDYNLGVVLVTGGPGGTNTITGVAAAWLESTPMLIISGQAKTEDLKGDTGVRQRGNQEIGIVDIVKSITKYAVTITNPDDIKYHLDRAIYEAKNGRQGPVWIDIPLDIQAATIDKEKLVSYQPKQESKNYLTEDIAEVAELLSAAERPLLIVGQGIERSNGKEVFRRLVDWLNIPVLTSWIAVELLEYNHPCNLGKPGLVAGRYSNFAMQKSDLVLSIGTRLDPTMIGYNPKEFAPNAKKCIVDIDETELDKFDFDIDKKIVYDGTLFIESLLDYMQKNEIETKASKWLSLCQKWKADYPIMQESFSSSGAEFVNPYHFIDKLSDAMEDDEVIIPGSSGAGIDVFWLCIKNRREQRMLATGALGSMGYGIPAAIGACLASGKRTICVEGDGSLQLNIQELASIKGMNLPIKIFVNNNKGYLSIMNMQRTHFDAKYVGANSESHLHIPDICEIARAYGFTVLQIDNHNNMEEIIQKALEIEGPVLCNVIMADEIAIQPKVMSKVSENGSMISGTLVDLYPFLPGEELGKVLGS